MQRSSITIRVCEEKPEPERVDPIENRRVESNHRVSLVCARPRTIRRACKAFPRISECRVPACTPVSFGKLSPLTRRRNYLAARSNKTCRKLRHCRWETVPCPAARCWRFRLPLETPVCPTVLGTFVSVALNEEDAFRVYTVPEMRTGSTEYHVLIYLLYGSLNDYGIFILEFECFLARECGASTFRKLGGSKMCNSET